MLKFRLTYTLILSFFLFLLPYPMRAAELVTVSGSVKNSKNKKPIENVSLTVPGSNISTVTNADGQFSLKIPENKIEAGIKAEQIGFQTIFIDIPSSKEQTGDLTILMTPTARVLKEVVVLGGDPTEIVRTALRKIPENYSDKDNLFSGFYRETVQKGNRFISISEAMVDVLKKPYKHRISNGDKVSIHKGRSLLSPRPADTLAVKIAGGPYMPVMLDAVKNGDHLFTIEELPYFDFKLDGGEMIDDRLHYVISFKPVEKLEYPLHRGKLFIDSDNLAISRVEFDLDMSDKNKVTKTVLRKKPTGLHFKPQEVSGVVTYKLIDGKSYINYISSRIRFKCDWKKRLFSSGYTTNAEMVMVDRDDSPEKKLKFTNTFGQRNIFADVVDNYWEADFWKDYNIIEPTESLEKAVDKLKKLQ